MNGSPSTPTATREALEHELHVHQVELVQQSEELQRTQVNLTGSSLLRPPRASVPGKPLARFVSSNDADRWHLYLHRALARETLVDRTGRSA